MGPASCQVLSSLESEERDVKEGGWDAGSLSAEAQVPVPKPWVAGRGRGGPVASAHPAQLPPLSRNAGDPHWGFSWMTSARKC